MTASVLSLAAEPAYRSVPLSAGTLGGDVASFCRSIGFAPDPAQEMILREIFAVDRRGRSTAFETAVIACRQNLKTGVFKQAVLGWLFVADIRLVVWSAHEWDTIKEAFRDLEELISGADALRKLVRHIYRGNGDEAIELLSGARVIFKTRTKGGGRGLTGDKVVLDEAFALRPMHMGALLPTLSARPDPQVVYGSSAGLVDSAVLRSIRDRGRAGKDPRLAYFEWCAPPPEEACRDGDRCTHSLTAGGCGCDDPEQWRKANPAMGLRITAEHIAAERRAMPPEEFGRERMGWWDSPMEERKVITDASWRLLADEGSEPVPPVAFACVFSADRSRAAIDVAGQRADGLLHVEVAEYRKGTSWAAPWLIDRWQRHQPCAVVVDAAGHEGSIIPELEQAGIEVVSPQARDIAQAYGQFYDAVTDSQSLRHRDQDDLNVALAGATVREIGDAGKAWGRRASGTDIAPLVAATEALWGFLKFGPAGDYDAGQSVHFDVGELIRLCKAGIYGPADIARIWSRGLLGDKDLARLAEAGVPVPAGLARGV